VSIAARSRKSYSATEQCSRYNVVLTAVYVCVSTEYNRLSFQAGSKKDTAGVEHTGSDQLTVCTVDERCAGC
jgi:hypothetical protein